MSNTRRLIATAASVTCGVLAAFMGLAFFGMLVALLTSKADAPQAPEIVISVTLALLFAWLTRKCWAMRTTTSAPKPPAQTQPKPVAEPAPKTAAKPEKKQPKKDDSVHFYSKIYGTSQRNRDGTSRQAAIRKHCYPSAPLDLIREPQNKHDSNAIAVFYDDSQLGYLSADVAWEYAQRIDNGTIKLSARIEDITGGTSDSKTLGVNIRIQVQNT